MQTTSNHVNIIANGTVAASSTHADRQSCIAPWIAVLPGGRWLVSYRAARTKNESLQQVLVTWSDDEGRSWRPPFAPFRDSVANGRRGQFRAMACTPIGGDRLLATLWWVDVSDPTRPLFNTATEGILDSYLFVSESADAGHHWSEPVRIEPVPFEKYPCPLTGPMLQFANGDWALQFEPNRPYHSLAPHRYMPALIFSNDKGRTWAGTAQPSIHPEHAVCYGDQRPSVLASGLALDFFWTFDARTSRHLNIHAAASTDHGRTWSPTWDTGVPGQPAPARLLADGRLALVYVDRTGCPAIKLRLSADNGRTFPAVTEQAIHEPGLASQTTAKRTAQDMWAELQRYSIGLPDTATLENGDLVATYYTGPDTDRTGIDWVRLSIR